MLPGGENGVLPAKGVTFLEPFSVRRLERFNAHAGLSLRDHLVSNNWYVVVLTLFALSLPAPPPVNCFYPFRK